MDNQAKKLTQDGKERCRFELFVKLNDGLPTKFAGGARVWTFRGDKYHTEPDKMLRDLVRNVKNHYKEYQIMMIKDNSYDEDEWNHLLLHLYNNRFEKNILFEEHGSLLSKYQWPDWIKKVVHAKDEDHPR